MILFKVILRGEFKNLSYLNTSRIPDITLYLTKWIVSAEMASFCEIDSLL